MHALLCQLHWHDEFVTTSSGIYLGVGTVMTESVTSKIHAAGSRYVLKLLKLKPVLWLMFVISRIDLGALLITFAPIRPLWGHALRPRRV